MNALFAIFSELSQFTGGINPTLLVGVTVFCAAAALVAAVMILVREMGTSTAEDRLATLTGRKSDGAMREEIVKEGMDGLSGIFRGFSDRLNSLGLLFEQADSPIKPETFFLISGGCALVGAVAAVAFQAPLPLVPLAAVLTALLPLMWLMYRRKQRFKAFAAQLPDALELVGRALRSGHSLASGLHVVVQEMPNPISTEFGNAYEEQNLGVPLEQALKNMLKRMPNMDLKFFVTAVAIQRQAGGDMAEILDKISYIIRERFKIMGQVMALTGEGRISGVVLMILPVAIFVAVWYLNPDYVMLLFTEELGRKMIAVAAVLQVLGAVVIKKIVAIKI
ncbi:type II secretion system F family protein [Stratiformator vulcanicus]|uniref:Bacterial type II secretion system protein F domain protein n=1 Tax=Stratiformator vulcanicus TaxID=2527980 RepID=A0A517R4N3_9PLAN|nr:type II secretion system F family protein [Stratiformator vulcanicus]QDT38836.1 Bacterial type II secretion system protein F domain protein [Stratiformator vulcanicus]